MATMPMVDQMCSVSKLVHRDSVGFGCAMGLSSFSCLTVALGGATVSLAAVARGGVEVA